MTSRTRAVVAVVYVEAPIAGAVVAEIDDAGNAVVEEPLGRAEVRKRAASGAVVVTLRGILVGIVGFAGVLVLARLLTPHDFGVVAIGGMFLGFALFVADGGIGVMLIRTSEAPERRDLETVLALQLVAAIGLSGAIALIALPFGEIGQVTAVMVASLPLSVLRTPGVIVLERSLSFRPIARAEVAQAVAYYVWAISTVVAGWGVWGLATGAPVRAAVGSALILAAASEARVLRPRFDIQRTRRLIGFGARYQAVGVANLARNQALNISAALVGGVATLGLWSVARRLMGAPYVLFTSLGRVSYPAMSRLILAGQNPAPIVIRAVALVAVAGGLLLAPLGASAPALIPSLLGERWAEAADVLPWAAAGLLIYGPVSVALMGYLWASGDSRLPLRASTTSAVVWVAVALALLPVTGVAALGVGWLASAITAALILGRECAKRLGASILSPLSLPLCASIAGGAAGWTVASSMDASLATAVLSACLAEGVTLAIVGLLRRSLVADLVATTAGAFRSSFASTSPTR